MKSEFIYDVGPYPSVHASTIVETSEGSLLTAWFGGTGESRDDVCIYLSRYEDGEWTSASAVADGVQGDGSRFPSWNPVLFQAKDGPLILFYKVGPWPAAWWGMMKTSEDDGRTWSAPHKLPEGVLGPIKNKPIQLADGTLIAPSSTEDPGEGGAGWQVQIELSKDLGKTWQVVGPLNTKEEFNAIQPSILVHEGGRLQILCRTMEKQLVTSWSEDNGLSWSKLKPTGLHNPNSGSDAVTLKDGRQLLVYNMRDGLKTPEGMGEMDRCPLNVSLSEDGVNWEMVLVLEDKPLPSGYAYPAVIQTSDGLVHITYTWDRQKIKHVVLDPAEL
ncbi:sialidase family protein [Pelagicoccus albus]|uniref:sialidase family protein n=1 Tax=Pelagicoccus albus TaxID=415222 RepID=UPI001C8B7012